MINVGRTTAPVHDVQKIYRTGQEAIETATVVQDAGRQAQRADAQAGFDAQNRMSVDPANAPIGLPRASNQGRFINDLTGGTMKAARESVSGFVDDVSTPFRWLGNKAWNLLP